MVWIININLDENIESRINFSKQYTIIYNILFVINKYVLTLWKSLLFLKIFG